MGRPAKSNLEKFLTGNPGRRQPLTPAAASVPGGLPPMPATLSEAARPHWKKIGKQLSQGNVVKRIDGTLFGVLCETLADLDSATARLRAEGQTITDNKGRLIRNPLSVSVQNLRAQVSSLSDKFGLSPKSRSTFASDPAPAANHDTELDDMLAGGDNG
ncbi:MAG: phage terminase small subunit P27 family [Patescibacteria group bacterium]|nr:phage terminase small subunit P27 family [Patescibacteria group bacterium]